MLSGLKKELEEYVINEGEECPKCGGRLKVIGKQIIRTEVEFIQAKLIVKQIVRQVAKCENCGKKDSENKTPVFVKAGVPAPVLPHSFSTPSLAALVMYLKFMMGVPFDRQEKEWFRYPMLNTPECFSNDSGAGGLKTTVDDIARFCEMMRQDGELDGVRVLSPLTARTMRKNVNADMPNTRDAWTLGFNYRGSKLNDWNIMRSATTIDHIAYGGARIFIDIENGLSGVYFGVVASNKVNPFDKFSNIVYSALAD